MLFSSRTRGRTDRKDGISIRPSFKLFSYPNSAFRKQELIYLKIQAAEEDLKIYFSIIIFRRLGEKVVYNFPNFKKNSPPLKSLQNVLGKWVRKDEGGGIVGHLALTCIVRRTDSALAPWVRTHTPCPTSISINK